MMLWCTIFIIQASMFEVKSFNPKFGEKCCASVRSCVLPPSVRTATIDTLEKCCVSVHSCVLPLSDENTGVSDESTDVIQLLIKFKSTLSDTLVSVIKMQHEI